MKKILICDDNVIITEICVKILTKLEYKPVVLHTYHDVVDKVISIKPNLILLDLEMPGISGEKALLQLKKNVITKDIPVVVFSSSHYNYKELLNCGAVDFLPKPFDLKEFKNIISRNLS